MSLYTMVECTENIVGEGDKSWMRRLLNCGVRCQLGELSLCCKQAENFKWNGSAGKIHRRLELGRSWAC